MAHKNQAPTMPQSQAQPLVLAETEQALRIGSATGVGLRVEVTLTPEQSERFERLSSLKSQAQLLASAVADQLDGKAKLIQNFTADKAERYCDVWQVRINGLDIALKFRAPASGLSKESAMTELAVDDESLRGNRPGMVPYAGRIVNSDGHILAVMTKCDFSPGIADALLAKEYTRREIREKLISLFDTFAETNYHLCDDNADNIRIKEDGSLFVIDGAAVSKHNRYAMLPGSKIVACVPLDGEISDLSPDCGLYSGYESLYESEFGLTDYEEPFAADAPEVPDYLSSAQLADHILKKIKAVHAAQAAA